MPHFYHYPSDCFLSTNYKVMFSHITYSNLFYDAKYKKLVLNSLRGKVPFTFKKEHYLLARHPYSRLVSFYKDKFQNHPKYYMQKDFSWQHCQYIIFKELGIIENSNKQLSEKLLNTSFSDFLNILSKIYLLDGHLKPQVNILKFRYKKILFTHQISRILKMENENDMLFLKDKFHLDITKRFNSTNHIDVSIKLSLKDMKIINEIYEEDFRKLDYNPL